MFVLTPCACCLSTVVMAIFAGIVVIILAIGQVLSRVLPKDSTSAKVFKFSSRIMSGLIVLIAIFFGVLTTNERLRSYTFFKLFERLSTYPNPMDEMRCSDIQHLSGRVLEFGPGPGTNFRCWQNNTKITEWVGVEPNEFFQEKIAAEVVKMNISFPTKTVWLRGENVDIEPASFDYVVGTHVLCSVDDVSLVLRQASRALKPGGVYHFMEHIAAKEGSTLYFWQQVFEPLLYVVANGCKFKTLWNDLSASAGLPGFDVTVEFMDSKIPIPLFVPHLKGLAVKL
jgi:SAM-dependent methyltransferase